MAARDVPPGWRRSTLAELGTFHKGYGGTKKDQQESGVPVIRYGELYTRHHDIIRRFGSFISPASASNYVPLRAGDVLFAGSGETLAEIGKSAAFLGPEPAFGGGDLIILRPDGSMDPSFLGYATNGPDAASQKSRMGQGSSVMHVHTRNLEQLSLLVPPLAEQRKIAAILSSVDETIEKTEAVIEQLQVVKKAMMEELLTRGMPGRHTRFKQTEIGEVPEAWAMVPLERAATLITDGEHQTPKRQESGVLLLSARNVQNGYLDLSTVDYVGDEEFQRIRRRCDPQFDDILVSCSGSVGRVCRVPEGLPFGLVRSVALVKPDRTRILPAFLELVLQSPALQMQMELEKRQAAQANLFQGQIRRLLVPIPSMDEQTSIAVRVQAMTTSLRQEAGALRELRESKSALSAALLSGDLRVTPDEAPP